MRTPRASKQLLAGADAHQQSADPMAAAHHYANVLFNVMRGGVFVDGTRMRRDDLMAALRRRHAALADTLAPTIAAWPESIERAEAIAAARAAGRRPWRAAAAVATCR